MNRKKVLILGAGGHGLVVADILQYRRDVEVIGFLDDKKELAGSSLLSLPILGRLADVSRIPHDTVMVAIGDNRCRQKVVRWLKNQGICFCQAIHPFSNIGSLVQIGPGTCICSGAVVGPGSNVGAQVILNTLCSVDHHNVIGDYVHVAPGAHLGGNVRIGEGTLVGIGACVLPGIRIGAWSVIGAGSVVNRDIGDGVVVWGNPGRVRRNVGKELWNVGDS